MDIIFDLISINLIKNKQKDIKNQSQLLIQSMDGGDMRLVIRAIHDNICKENIVGRDIKDCIKLCIKINDIRLTIKIYEFAGEVALRIVPPADTIIDEYRAILECIMLRKNNNYINKLLIAFSKIYMGMIWLTTFADTIFTTKSSYAKMQVMDFEDCKEVNDVFDIMNLYICHPIGGKGEYIYNRMYVCVNRKNNIIFAKTDKYPILTNRSTYYYRGNLSFEYYYFEKKYTILQEKVNDILLIYKNDNNHCGYTIPLSKTRKINLIGEYYVIT